MAEADSLVSKSGPRKLKILVADDDPINRKYLRALLTRHGHDVVECCDGLTTLARLESDPCDAVISDVLMPRMDGYRLCYEIRRNKNLQHTPVILYTATYLSAEDEKAAMAMGADRFVRKPAEPATILAALDGVVEHSRSPRSLRLRKPADRALREYSEVLVRKLEESIIGLSVANAALSEQERRLRTIIESEPECVKVLAADNTLLEINPAGLRMIEAENASEIIGSKADKLIVPEHRRDFLELTEAAFRGEARTLAFEITGLKGTRRWLESHTVPLRNSAGEIVACLGISRDITEQRQSAALVNDQLRVLEMIAGGAPLEATLNALLHVIEAQCADLICSILLLDNDGLHLRSAAAPTLPRTFLEAINGRAAGEGAGSCGTAVHRRQPVIVEDIAVDPLWKEWRALALEHNLRACCSTPIFDTRQQVLGSFAMYFRTPRRPSREHRRLIDVATHTAAIAITRKREENALRESEARFREMADSAPVMIRMTRADGFCTYLNRQWQEFTGQSPDRGLADEWLDALHPADRLRVREHFIRANERHDSVRLEYRMRRQDGEYRWVIDSAQPRHSEGGEFLGYIGSVFDITERKQAEDERQRNLERARALHEVNLAITSEMDLQSRLDVLLEQIQRFLPHPIVSSVRLLRPETGELEHLAFRGIDAQQWLTREPGRRLQRARQVIAKKAPVVVADLKDETPAGGAPNLSQLGLMSYAGIPLIARDQVLGVLAVYTKERHQFDAAEIEFLAALGGQAALAIHNAQLYETAERRRHEAEELARIARSLTETLDMRLIGERVVSSVLDLFRVRGSSLRLSQPDGSMARFVSAGEVFSQTEAGAVIPAGTGLAGCAFAAGKTVWCADTLNDPSIKFERVMRDYIASSGNGSMMAVPLRVRESNIGMLTLTDRTGRSYSEREVELVRAFADQVALALQNARLYEQSGSQLRRMEALREIEKAITSTLDLTSVLQFLLDRIDVFLPFSAATTIRLYDPTTGKFENAACRNIDEQEWKTRIGQGSGSLSGRLLRTKRPVVVRNMQDEPGISASRFYREYGFVSYLAVPLIAKEEIVGVLAFYTKTFHDFAPEEIDLVLTLAGQAAIAINNARLYKDIERSKQELVVTNRMLETSLKQLDGLYTALAPIAAEPTAQDLMNGIIDRVIAATGADAALIRLLDSSTGGLPIVAHRGFPAEYIQSREQAPLAGAVAWVLQHAEPIIAPDIAAESKLQEKIQLRLGLRSCAVLPVEVHGQVQGILHVASRALDRYDSTQRNHLIAIARQMSIAVENRRLFDDVSASRDELELANERLVESNRRLSALHAVAAAASQAMNLTRVLDRAMEKIREIFGFEAIRIHLYDEPSGRVALRASLEKNPEQFAGIDSVSRGLGIIGTVVESGSYLVFEDVDSDPRYDRLSCNRIARKFHHRFFAVFPIRSKLQVLGAMSCIGTESRKLAMGEIQLLEALADQLAVAIENTGLYEAVNLKVDELQRKTTELELANRVKDEFLSVVSHELRTPINVIMGYTSLLKEGVLGTVKAAQEEALAKIARESKDLLSMINTLLYASTIDTEPVTLDSQKFQPEELLAELRANYAVTVGPQVTMVWRYPANLPALRTDRRKLRQILDNLIGNAIKFTERGTVAVSARSLDADCAEPANQQSFVEFEVTDTGVGMPEDKLTKIFEKFYQVDSSESRSFGGVGMGLYLAKRFADLLGGTILVESFPGRGSTFYLRIPAETQGRADGGS